MRKIAGYAIVIAASLVWAGNAMADIPMPTKVKFFFERGGKPHEEAVDFKVLCYGWSWHPGKPRGERPEPYEAKQIYDYGGHCPKYGCEIRHDLYLNYKQIDYCNLEGRTIGVEFKIEKFGSHPTGGPMMRCPKDGKCEKSPSCKFSGEGGILNECELHFEIPD